MNGIILGDYKGTMMVSRPS